MNPDSAGDFHCGCKSGHGRRDFLKTLGLGAAATSVFPWQAVAGPFEGADFEQLVPADKKLRPEWLRSLVERGSATVYRGADLRWIGMPIGGICAGQLYLGGDGKLWHWDIFNQVPAPDLGSGAGPHYANPLKPLSPLEQGFAIRTTAGGKSEVRPLASGGFPEIEFRGQYPIGLVLYRAPDSPVTVALEAFSPFVPLDPDNSSLPATILNYTVRNTSEQTVTVEIAGWIENAVCLSRRDDDAGFRRNRIRTTKGMTFLDCTLEASPLQAPPPGRPDIVFEDFEKGTYEGWTVTGTAFGPAPVEAAKMPAYQGEVGAKGKRLVNSHNVRNGEDVNRGDAHVGTLTSRPFTIERSYINFLIGGGSHQDRTCLHLLVDDKVVLSATGASENRMQPRSFDVRRFASRTARLQIVDNETGAWGNVGVDDIVFSDRPRERPGPLSEQPDFGTMGLGILNQPGEPFAVTSVGPAPLPRAVFDSVSKVSAQPASMPLGQKLVGAVGQKLKLRAGKEATFSFVVTWWFPGFVRSHLRHIKGISDLKRSYANQFGAAAAVGAYVEQNFKTLADQTRLWHQTWYDSTLPWWFLDRTFLNTSILATATCYRFDSGRFYGWEGTYCCAGTCTHVWQYAQAVGRVFPQLERATREMVDYGLAFHPETGAMDYRCEADRRVAVDGQAGTILRAYREHQMSPHKEFLERNWFKIRKSIEYLMRQDGNDDGILEGSQYNTLDAAWYGQITWLSSLYLAAVQAGAAMAREMGDDAFAARAEAIVESGSRLIAERLWNGEYFINLPDPAHPEAINSNVGCHIDQVLGQSWVFQVGLPRVLPPDQTRGALESLWRYNFTPDVGPYRQKFQAIKGGRWYAMPGEGGLLMCTFPKGGAEKAPGKGEPGFVAYFNECMTGFEYQVAAHMIWEGLVEKGLAVTRMIHDRYHPARRNPWNEVECSSHYARAMASYGVFLAACGYEYHGPKGQLGFAPRLSPENFKAAFTGAEGWGSFTQRREGSTQREVIEVKLGRLRLKTLHFELPDEVAGTRVTVTVLGRQVNATQARRGARAIVTLPFDVTLQAGERIEVVFA